MTDFILIVLGAVLIVALLVFGDAASANAGIGTTAFAVAIVLFVLGALGRLIGGAFASR